MATIQIKGTALWLYHVYKTQNISQVHVNTWSLVHMFSLFTHRPLLSCGSEYVLVGLLLNHSWKRILSCFVPTPHRDCSLACGMPPSVSGTYIASSRCAGLCHWKKAVAINCEGVKGFLILVSLEQFSCVSRHALPLPTARWYSQCAGNDWRDLQEANGLEGGGVYARTKRVLPKAYIIVPITTQWHHVYISVLDTYTT